MAKETIVPIYIFRDAVYYSLDLFLFCVYEHVEAYMYVQHTHAW